MPFAAFGFLLAMLARHRNPAVQHGEPDLKYGRTEVSPLTSYANDDEDDAGDGGEDGGGPRVVNRQRRSLARRTVDAAVAVTAAEGLEALVAQLVD